MTPAARPPGVRQARARVGAPLRSLGFVDDGTRWLYRSAELLHTVSLTAVRRLAGFVELQHQVQGGGDDGLELVEMLASHSHRSPYPVIWAADDIDLALLLEQVSAIVGAFQTLDDLQQHQLHGSERAAQALHRLGHEILGAPFDLAADNEDFDLWISRAQDNGLRHAVHLQANASGTLATLVHCTLPASAVDQGLAHEDTRRLLVRAARQVVCTEGRPLLIPLRRPMPWPAAAITTALQTWLRNRAPGPTKP